MLRAWRDVTQGQAANHCARLRSGLKGLPHRGLLTLETLRVLADGGHKLADDLIDEEGAELRLTQLFESRRRLGAIG